MSLIESILIAFGALWQNKLRSGLTMLGVIIGVFAVVTLTSLGQGAQQYVADQFAGMGTNLMTVTPGKRETQGMGPIMGASNAHKLTVEDAAAIRHRLQSVSAVSPMVFGLGLVKYNGKSRNTMVVGVGPELPQVRNLQMASGQFFSDDEVDASRRIAVIGPLVRRELFGDKNPLGEFVTVMGTEARIVGVMEPRGVSLGFDLDDLVYIPVTSAKRIFNTDGLTQVFVKARGGDDVDRARLEVIELLKERHGGVEDVTIVTQSQMLSTLNTILDVLTATLAGIAAISLLVGGIGIMNIMLVSVRERTREIGVRKAIGARSRDILMQFLVESVVLSLTGGGAGILFALLAQVVAGFFVPGLPVMITPWAVLLATSFSFVVGVFFGVYPARRASKLDPITALRTD